MMLRLEYIIIAAFLIAVPAAIYTSHQDGFFGPTAQYDGGEMYFRADSDGQLWGFYSYHIYYKGESVAGGGHRYNPQNKDSVIALMHHRADQAIRAIESHIK